MGFDAQYIVSKNQMSTSPPRGAAALSKRLWRQRSWALYNNPPTIQHGQLWDHGLSKTWSCWMGYRRVCAVSVASLYLHLDGNAEVSHMQTGEEENILPLGLAPPRGI